MTSAQQGRKSFINVEGKVAIVTGGTRGIGESIARVLGESGAKVVIASRKEEGVREAEARLRAAGLTDVLGVAAHTGKPEDVARLVKAAIERFGQVDILVNNAATNPHFGPMVTADEKVFAKTFEVNVLGYFECARQVANHLTSRGAPGSIVNVASIVGVLAAPLQGIYAMTKAAVISMTKTLAVELAPSNIRVNAIAPGLVETKFAAAITQNDDLAKRVLDQTPMARFGRPDEIAGAALYLASDAASFTTGTTIFVDGGLTIL